ncbi:sigma-70 family RNA polymerase sigma factor [Vibrio profundi]|uniref:sigma-70 family RNA polymerase sigma factor n=1 Tax=Vibrio profundi TaxID=1774960 RepID=UPI003735F83E
MQSSNPVPQSRQEWADCMELVKGRDKEAFATIFRFYTPRLKQFTFKHVGNEQVATEMVQETLSAVWQKAHLFDGTKSALSTWIYTIARNLCFDTLRKQKGKSVSLYSEDIWPEDYLPADRVESYSPEQDMLKEQVGKFLQLLPENQRVVMQAVYVQDISQQEVAELLDIPLGTVKSRLRLAVEKLRHQMRVEDV